jgi:hypothetical protein
MLYGINEDEGMRLWKLKVKKDKRIPSIFNDESTESFICL